MSGCNYFDYLSRDAIAELYASADPSYDATPVGEIKPAKTAELKRLLPPAEEQAAA